MRILLVRTSALGDVVHAVPVLTALRRHLPAARIGWVVEEPFAPLLAAHPDLDEVLVVRLRAWRRRLWSRSTRQELAAFFAQLDRFGADVALDLMGNHKGAALAALSLADRRIGAGWSDRREPTSAIWLSERVVVAGPHAVDRGLALLAALEVPSEPADFGAGRWLAALAPGTAAPPSRDYAFVHPGAAWGNKRYPPAAWGEVCRRLAGATGLASRIGAAPGEEQLAADVVAAAGGAAEIAPAPDLATLAGLLSHARLVLAGDTGPLHLAHAFGRPVVCVMGPTDPERHGPYRAVERAIVHRLPCSYCHQRMATARACLLEIAPAAVAARAAELLAPAPGFD
jgi:heptosyltransferase-1